MKIKLPNDGIYAVQKNIDTPEKVAQTMAQIIRQCAESDEVTERFYNGINQLSTNNESFIRRLANAVFSMVYFEADPPRTQIIKTPRATIRTERGNCVDYTVLLGAVAKRGGLNVVVRIVKLPGQNNFGHVYPIINGVPVDLVPGQDQTGREYLNRKSDARPSVGTELKFLSNFDTLV